MPSLRIFVREMIVQHPRAKQVRDQLKKSKFKRPKTRSALLDHKTLLSILPEKDIVDHYVRLYVNTLENTYRVLHLPSFWTDYEKLWDSPHETEAMFAVQVILMVAAMYCLPGNDNANGVGVNRDLLPAAQDTACYWIEECETWLDAQSQKHSTLAYMQAHCLLYIAKTMQCFKLKRSWTAAGTLMSFSLTRGFHRNTEIVNKQQGDDPKIRVSRFSQEMRRRLWSTIVELEMQAALERGIPTLLPDLISDCGAPRNCDDDNLNPGVEREPSSLPDATFTRTSYQSVSSKSLRLRQQVLSIINGSFAPTQGDFHIISNDLTNHLSKIPVWTSNDSIVPSALLQLQIYELIMFLHRSPTAQPQATNKWSSTLHIQAAKAILDTHQRLISASHRVLTVLRHDIASAALGVCYDFETSKSLPQPTLLTSETDHLSYLSTALSILEQKIDWMGVGVKAYYIIAACEGLVKKAKAWSGNQEALAAAKVTVLMERMVLRLAESKDVSMAHSLSNGVSLLYLCFPTMAWKLAMLTLLDRRVLQHRWHRMVLRLQATLMIQYFWYVFLLHYFVLRYLLPTSTRFAAFHALSSQPDLSLTSSSSPAELSSDGRLLFRPARLGSQRLPQFLKPFMPPLPFQLKSCVSAGVTQGCIKGGMRSGERLNYCYAARGVLA